MYRYDMHRCISSVGILRGTNNMKKWFTLVLLGACMLILGGCSKVKEERNTDSYIPGELVGAE